MAGVEKPGGVPRALTEAGLSDALWGSWDAAAEWCERRGYRMPLEAFAGHPRALRDHAAYCWVLEVYPSRWPGSPDWHGFRRAGIPGITGARTQARREAIEQLNRGGQ